MTILTVKADTLAPIEIDRQASRYGGSADFETYIDELVQRWLESGSTRTARSSQTDRPCKWGSGALAQRPAGLVACPRTRDLACNGSASEQLPRTSFAPPSRRAWSCR